MSKISPATAIASVALFFSLAGTGMAATGYRITSIWQISPKVRHALRGERGTVSFFISTSSDTTIPSGEGGVATAPCGARNTVVGGGFWSDGGLIASSSAPETTYQWTVTADNPTSTTKTLRAWAVCETTP